MNKKIILFLTIIVIAIGGISFYYFKNLNSGPEINPIINNEETPPAEDLSSYYSVKTIEANSKTIKSIGLTPDNFPPLDGATASQPIRALIACETFNVECNWYETEAKEMFLNPNLYNSNLSYEDQDKIRLKIEKNSKTHDAYLNLIQNKIDLILVSTKPSNDELEEAKELGVKLELVPIGLDGFIFLVNKENPIKNLNTSDIVNIYSGKVKNWSKFRGENSKITAFTRQPNSGSQELMDKLIMKEVAMDPSLKEERVIMTMVPLIEGVESTKNSIGYSLYYYKNNMIDKRDVRPNVKLISIDGVEPNPENISSKKYPHVFYIYAVTRANEPKTSIPYQIKEWLTSKEGQEIIKKAGYIKLNN